MHTPGIFRSFVLGLALVVAALAAHAQTPWEEKSPAVNGFGQLLAVDGTTVLTDRAGNPLVPSCAFGPFGDQFRFFVQPGDPSRLLLFHDGGGACWEANTCGSALTSARPTYDPRITESTQTLPFAGGVLDSTNPANPFKEWTKVFIPYCTGDVGWGNNVATYVSPALPSPGNAIQIHHRGYANIRAVVRWIQEHYAGGPAPAKVAFAGVSAGAYAAPAVVFPEVKKLLPPTTRTFVLADSGNGVVTDSFLTHARTNWGFDNTLPPYILSSLSEGAGGLPIRFYGELTGRFPATRFGQFQNAFDGIQAVVYNTMKFADDPLRWTDPQFLGPSLLEWTAQMRVAVNLSAAAPNYRYYTAAGSEHTILVNIPPELGAGFCSDDFYTESSAGGLRFRNWVNAMVNGGGFLWFTGDWRNATCAPNCIVPPRPGCAPAVLP